MDVQMISPEQPELIHVGKNITGNIGMPSGWLKIQSRYLRSPTASCHDQCKYGRKDPSGGRKNCPLLRSTTMARNEGHSLMTDVTLTNMKMNSVNNPKPSDAGTNVLGFGSSSKKLSTSSQQIPSSKSTNKVGFNKRTGLFGTNLGKSFNGRRKSEEYGVKRLVGSSPTPSLKRVASIAARNDINYRSLRRVSDAKNEQDVKELGLKKSGNEEVPEKTLYVIEPTMEYKTVKSAENGVNGTPSSPSSRWSQKSGGARNGSFPSLSRLSFDTKTLKHSKKESSMRILSASSTVLSFEDRVANPKAEKKGSPRKVISPRGIDRRQRKVSIRKGTQVKVAYEIESPRQLKFRKGQLLSEDGNEKSDASLSFRKKEEGEECDTNSVETESEKLVLRHQDVAGKKEGQSLFNNVIEATASKLAETRKSKVKALVGAFETVISLQDIKG